MQIAEDRILLGEKWEYDPWTAWLTWDELSPTQQKAYHETTGPDWIDLEDNGN